jgi:hypothetical protein
MQESQPKKGKKGKLVRDNGHRLASVRDRRINACRSNICTRVPELRFDVANVVCSDLTSIGQSAARLCTSSLLRRLRRLFVAAYGDCDIRYSALTRTYAMPRTSYFFREVRRNKSGSGAIFRRSNNV